MSDTKEAIIIGREMSIDMALRFATRNVNHTVALVSMGVAIAAVCDILTDMEGDGKTEERLADVYQAALAFLKDTRKLRNENPRRTTH